MTMDSGRRALLTRAGWVETGPPLPPWDGVLATGADWAALARDGARPLRVDAGLDPAADLPTEGYQLRMYADAAGDCHLDASARTEAGLRHARRAAAVLLASDGGSVLTLRDQPAIARRGFLECYYGAPWPTADRLTMLAEAAYWGMNAYCYGPSGDPRTGTDWRSPYTTVELDGFGELAGAGDQLGVEICWRISPSSPLRPQAGIVFSDPQDRQRLMDRLREVVGTGVRTVLLAFDDVEHGLFHDADRRAYASAPHPIAAAHAELAELVGAELDGLGSRLVVCPVRYWGTGSDRYSAHLADRLDGAVELCWTGPQVTSTRIRTADAVAARDRFRGRRLWLWDNYPVNDWDGFDPRLGEPARRRLFLGPLTGRDGDLDGQLGSYLVNCGVSPLSGLLALATAAQWAWRPAAYDPAVAHAAALNRYDDADGRLALLADLDCTSPLRARRRVPVADAAWRYLLADGDGSGAELRRLLTDLLDRLRPAPGAPVGAVLRALDWWLDALTRQLTAAVTALDVLDAAGGDDPQRLVEAAAALADRRQELDDPYAPALLDAALVPLIERARGLAGAPLPPSDV